MTDPAALPTFGLPVPLEPSADGAGAARPAGPPTGEPGTGPGPTPSAGTAPVDPSASDAAGPARLEALRDRVVRALTEAGYPAHVDEDGDVAVEVQEQKLFVRCADSVPALMRVFGQWLMDDLPRDELARLRAANAVTATVNLAKASVHDDRLVVAVDLIVADGMHLPSLLHASLDAVLGCVRTWHAAVLQFAG